LGQLLKHQAAQQIVASELASSVFNQPYQASKGTFTRRNLATLANRLNSSVSCFYTSVVVMEIYTSMDNGLVSDCSILGLKTSLRLK
jgi:hypothetical protein